MVQTRLKFNCCEPSRCDWFDIISHTHCWHGILPFPLSTFITWGPRDRSVHISFRGVPEKLERHFRGLSVRAEFSSRHSKERRAAFTRFTTSRSTKNAIQRTSVASFQIIENLNPTIVYQGFLASYSQNNQTQPKTVRLATHSFVIISVFFSLNIFS